MSDPLSVKWLKQAQRVVNEDPEFRKLGYVDTNMGLKVGRGAYLVIFSGFSCHGVHKLDGKDLRDADYVVEMTPAAWERFVEGRRTGAGPTLVELDQTDCVIKAENPRRKLDFLRYHVSLQAFLDAGAAAA
ncbi:MAG: hypothetical protein H6993_09670 [Pseudomonadales bacterium]|nr:hypothetical protein [Pseudomonadales bacterium]